MQATVQIDPNGTVVVVLDSDEDAEDDDARALLTLRADDLLDQCARVAIATWLEIHGPTEAGE